ncbi:MAG: hypothetical protein NTV80_17560, partial [Verrucomicrobia bacterium]|nr:hypothetical protein [Verrucomicrobiota bacterium]
MSLTLFCGSAFAEAPGNPPVDQALLTLDRLFTVEEFKEDKATAIRWSKKSSDYFTLDTPKVGKDGKDGK